MRKHDFSSLLVFPCWAYRVGRGFLGAWRASRVQVSSFMSKKAGITAYVIHCQYCTFRKDDHIVEHCTLQFLALVARKKASTTFCPWSMAHRPSFLVSSQEVESNVDWVGPWHFVQYRDCYLHVFEHQATFIFSPWLTLLLATAQVEVLQRE